MNVRAKSAFTKDVGRAMQVFARTARARQMYRSNNAVLVRMMNDLTKVFHQLLADQEEISLRVRSDALIFDEDPVLEEPNPEQSLPFALYRDGIRRLDLYHGLSKEELEVLVSATAIGFSYNGLGDDLVSYLWRHDLEHVRYVVVDTTITDALPPSIAGNQSDVPVHDIDSEIDSLLYAIYGDSSDDVGPKSVRVDATDLPAKAIAQSLDEVDDLIPGFFPWRALAGTPAAADRWKSEILADDEHRLTLRALSSALDALASPMDFGVADGLFDTLLHMFDAALVQGDLDLPARIILGVRELGKYEHAAAAAESWISEAIEEARLRQATTAFARAPSLEAMRSMAAFFRACGPASTPALLSMTPRIENPQERRVLSALAVEIGLPSNEPVAHMLQHEQAFVAQEAVYILARLGTPEARRILAQERGHAHAPVRLAILSAARSFAREDALGFARAYIDDEDAKVVALAARTLVELNDRDSADLLEERIQADAILSASFEKKRSLLRAFAFLRRAHAVPVIARVIRSGDDDIAVAAIEALTLTPTPGAIAALKKACLSLNRRVRESAREALTELRSGGAS